MFPLFLLKVVEQYDEEQRARLLQFVTGSSRIPIQGFKALQGMNLSKLNEIMTILFYECFPKENSTGGEGRGGGGDGRGSNNYTKFFLIF